MQIRLSISFFFVLCLSNIANGQEIRVASTVHTLHKINSQVLGEERSILVRVPANYSQTDERYPVIFMTDAHAPQNAMMVGLIEQQAWAGMIPEMIVVGIQNTNRTRDLTPTAINGVGGGSSKFLRFIENEVAPYIEKYYRTEPFRIFAGHSYGGLFAVYAFAESPNLFNAIIAASPTLDWDHNFLIKRAEESLKRNTARNRTIFLALANESDISSSFNTFKDLLKKTDSKGLEYEFRNFPDENHGSVVLPAYLAGIRKIFSGWPPPPKASVPELEEHYKRLSSRFGYRVVIPETLLNQIGYQYLRMDRSAEAIDVFKKNIANHPNSANCFDSLAEAYEKSGSLKLASENYEKAYKLAEAQGIHDLAKSSRANFERIKSKTK